MYWSRVKTILIILFLCINTFLLISMMTSLNQSIVISNETINNTVEVLQKNDIALDRDSIPRKIENLSFLVIKNVIEDKDAFAQKLLGAIETEKQNNQNEDIQYKTGNKMLTLKGGSSFEYIENAAAITLTAKNQDAMEKNIRDFMKDKLGLSLDYIITSHIDKKQDGGYIFTFYQQYKGKEIFESEMTAEISANGQFSISGYAIVPTELNPEKLPGRQVTSILMEFMRREDRPKDQVMTITDLSLGYYAKKDMEFKTVSAIPVWRIKADIQNGGEYVGYFEALKMSDQP